MQWFTISHGRRAGPFDTDQLLEMFQTNEITLDTLIVPEGGRIARRVFCAPEIFFDDIVTHGPAQRTSPRPQSGRSATRVARLTRPSQDARARTEDGDNSLDAHSQADLPNKGAAARRQQHDASSAKKAGQKASHKAMQRSLKAKRSAPEPTPEVTSSESPRDIPLPSLVNQQPRPSETNPGLFRGEPRQAQAFAADNTGPNSDPAEASSDSRPSPPPAHQLPKAASEAQFKPKESFGWAKNRVNPTALSSSMYSTERPGRAKKKLQPRPLETRALPPEMKLLFAGLVTVIVLLFIANLIVNRPPPPRQPRFSESRGTEIDARTNTGAASLDFEEADPIVVRPAKPPARKKPSEVKRRETQAKPAASQKKQQQKPSTSKKETRSPATPKSVAKAQRPESKNSKNLKARRTDNTGTPSSWPKIKVQGSEDLARNTFKQVTIESVRLLQMPKNCSPCQVPAILRDGTKILLTSQNLGPWKTVQKLGSINVRVNGLLSKTGQGTYSIIVRDVAP